MHPLDSARELLASAMENIDDLSNRLQQFLDDNPGKIEFDSIDRNVVLGWFRLEKPISTIGGRPEQKWGVAADVITGQMRSALDHAVYSLSAHDQDGGIHPDNPGVRTQFPIFTARNEYLRKRARDLAGITEEHKKVIDEFQPFQRATTAERLRDPLAELSALDNRKKHRTTNVGFLMRAGKGSTTFTVEAVDPPRFSGEKFETTALPWRFEDGAVTVRVTLPEGIKRVNIQHHPGTAQFAAYFGTKKTSMTRLKEIHKYVYSVLTRLDPLFI